MQQISREDFMDIAPITNEEIAQWAERDFNSGGSYGYDRDRYGDTSDTYNEVYTKEFDRLRHEEDRRQERLEEERAEERRCEQQRLECEIEAYWATLEAYWTPPEA